MRRFWKGDGGTASEFATRLAGSSDLYAWSGRKPYASINFLCHDGFCLQDLVSYKDKPMRITSRFPSRSQLLAPRIDGRDC